MHAAYPIPRAIALVKRSVDRMARVPKHDNSNDVLRILGPQLRGVGERRPRAVVAPAQGIRRDLRALREAQQGDLPPRARGHAVLDARRHGLDAQGLGRGVVGEGGRVGDGLDDGVGDLRGDVVGYDADAACAWVLACCAGDEHVEAVCAV